MDDGAPRRPEVWRPGVDGMDEDEELEYDPTVYDCLHAWSLEWPCLSFDVVRDELGEDRTHFPHSMFMVAGTQAQSAEQKPGTHSSPGPGPRRSCVVFRPSRGTCTLGRNALRLFLSSSLATSSAMGAASVGLDGCDAFI